MHFNKIWQNNFKVDFNLTIENNHLEELVNFSFNQIAVSSHLLEKSLMENFFFCAVYLTPRSKTLKIPGNTLGVLLSQPFLLLCNFTVITLWHGRSPVNLLHIFRIPFLKNTYGRLLLNISDGFFFNHAILRTARKMSP